LGFGFGNKYSGNLIEFSKAHGVVGFGRKLKMQMQIMYINVYENGKIAGHVQKI
jgi:hypothetical protein